MDQSITLHHFVGIDIKIDIEARFEENALIIEGYDFGRQVEEYWGDSDYEYSLRIPALGVIQLYSLFGIEPVNRENLLQELAKRYNTNSCFSEIRKLSDDHHIPCEGFSWM